jgi:hypothetical protein
MLFLVVKRLIINRNAQNSSVLVCVFGGKVLFLPSFRLVPVFSGFVSLLVYASRLTTIVVRITTTTENVR